MPRWYRIGFLAACLTLPWVCGCGPAEEAATSLRVDGSDTMVNLAQAWAETYHKRQPDMSVQVLGSGSGGGIARPPRRQFAPAPTPPIRGTPP